jgi:hypothetical protein
MFVLIMSLLSHATSNGVSAKRRGFNQNFRLH